MEAWKSVLKDDPTDWLLGEDNPSVRYFALRDLMGRPESNPAVVSAREEIMRRGPVPELLEKQRDPSYLAGFPRFYTSKYAGLVWSLIALAELGATPNAQIREQCEYLFRHSQDLLEGGFSQSAAARTGGGRLREVIPCLTGNMAWCLIRMGYLDDPRLQKGISWLDRHLRFNDGEELSPQDEVYDNYEMCWGKHSCHMGVVKALKAYSAIPGDRRSPETRETLGRAVEFMLIHHIHKRSHNLGKLSKPGWKKFGFPLMYQTDALEVLDILSALGVRDPRMGEALSLVLDKQGENGRWRLENAYAGERALVPFEAEGDESKWLTLRALRVIRAQFG